MSPLLRTRFNLRFAFLNDFFQLLCLTGMLLSESLKFLLQPGQLLVRKIFEIDHIVSSTFNTANQLIQFQMDSLGITVLRILDQKHHQERDDCRSSVNHELPGIRKLKNRPGNGPQDRKSTRLNSSHTVISYAVFFLKKKKNSIRVTAD